MRTEAPDDDEMTGAGGGRKGTRLRPKWRLAGMDDDEDAAAESGLGRGDMTGA